MQSLQKKLTANRLLHWFEEKKLEKWPVEETENIVNEASVAMNEATHNIWKSYDLLRLHGRVAYLDNAVQVVNKQPLDTLLPLRVDIIVPEELIRYCSRRGISVDDVIDTAIGHFIFEVIYKER